MMDGEEDDIGGDLDVADEAEAELSSAETLQHDVEEAVGQQLERKGDPNAWEGLEGRNDSHPGGRFEWAKDFETESRRNGTTLEKAVKDYVALETVYRQDPVNGVIRLAQQTGVDPRRLVMALNHRLNGVGASQYPAAAQQQMHLQAQYERHVQEVAQFERNPAYKHFAVLRNPMARLVQEGRARTIPEAYKMALRANPKLGIQDRLDRELSRKDTKRGRR